MNMDKRKNNRRKPAGSGPCGALRLRLAALPVGEHYMVTPENSGADNQEHLYAWLSGVRSALKKTGFTYTMMSLREGIYVKRLS
jgi:hypothetical protein